jgi:hypothetical protein
VREAHPYLLTHDEVDGVQLWHCPGKPVASKVTTCSIIVMYVYEMKFAEPGLVRHIPSTSDIQNFRKVLTRSSLSTIPTQRDSRTTVRRRSPSPPPFPGFHIPPILGAIAAASHTPGH